MVSVRGLGFRVSGLSFRVRVRVRFTVLGLGSDF